VSSEGTEAVGAAEAPAPAPAPSAPPNAGRSARHDRSRRRPSPLLIFAIAFVVLLASAVCVLIGNVRATSLLLPEISLLLSIVAVVLTIVALVMPAKPNRPEGSSKQ
jgi:hypothetical protein